MNKIYNEIDVVNQIAYKLKALNFKDASEELIDKVAKEIFLCHRQSGITPDKFLDRFTQIRTVCPSLFNTFIKPYTTVDSLEELDSYILATQLTQMNPKENISSGSILKLLNLGYNKTDIITIYKNNLSRTFLIPVFPKLGLLNITPLLEGDFEKKWISIYPKALLFAVFGKNVDLDEISRDYFCQKVENCWDHFIIRSASWSKNSDYNNADQKRYGSLMQRATLIGTEGIKNNEWTFYQLLIVLSYLRMKIAEELHPSNSRFYGNFRTQGLKFSSYLKNEYQDMASRLIRLRESYVGDYLINDGHYSYTFGKIGSKNIPLSHFDFSSEEVVVIHTHQRYMSKILSHVENLYQQSHFLQDKETLGKMAGKIFWWICKAKPWMRGDPSIAELLIKTLYQFHGIEPPAWKKGIIPWAEVEVEPNVSKFAQKFNTLLE